MVEKKVCIENPTGLHARPASQLCKFCQEYKADKITILSGTREIEPKSIISILSAGVKCGTEVTVRVDGEDEGRVCDDIVLFIANLKE